MTQKLECGSIWLPESLLTEMQQWPRCKAHEGAKVTAVDAKHYFAGVTTAVLFETCGEQVAQDFALLNGYETEYEAFIKRRKNRKEQADVGDGTT